MSLMQVVFSRPVIALGSDFGKEDNVGGKVAGWGLMLEKRSRIHHICKSMAMAT